MKALFSIPEPEKPKVEESDDEATRWLSRFMNADGRSIYTMFMEPYAGPDSSYDIANHLLKAMYNRFVKPGLWDGMKFLRVTLWALENRMDLNRYVYARGSRKYDAGNLPYGKAATISGRIMREIAGED